MGVGNKMITHFLQAHIIPKPLVWLYLDCREGPFIDYIEEWLIDQLRKGLKPIFDIEVVELEIGDVQVSNNHVFEIKRINKQYNPYEHHNNNDLQSSLWDGRLFEQTYQRQAFEWSGIILEIEPGAKSTNQHFTKDTFNDLIDELCFNYNQHILYSTGFEETLQILIRCLMKDLKKGDHHDPTNKEKRPSSLLDQQRYFLSGLIGMGKKNSLLILQSKLTPLKVIKWILDTEISYTKNGKIKGTNNDVSGFGPEFFLKNQRLLNTIAKEVDIHDQQ
jgi:ERCC4-type nuclease